MEATAKDLRLHSKKLIESVKRGEEVVITYRGKPCARLVPYQNHISKEEKHQLFGIWRDRQMTDNVEDYVRAIRKGRFKC
ncbi:type II toxin-antitoxin system prevent-host-death family antitoxin [candidate division KSB3 bacterium]|uniref:Antitoxin n=1 Tax=candidate division KSB3 bacterium TaxID=2044937 RepID=A0A2G6E7P6_9BACT|nr:MAG: type II toxin-antitoxin system prevent-host-death family antitoxin [candidate division KSB3 bacterium]